MKSVICLSVSSDMVDVDNVIDRKCVLLDGICSALNEIYPEQQFVSILANSLFYVGTPTIKGKIADILWDANISRIIEKIPGTYIVVDMMEVDGGCLISLEGYINDMQCG